jgi:hypothetical protein
MSESPFAGARFNIIKHRGDPKEATTLSGHTVKKEEFVYLRVPTDMSAHLHEGDWMMVKCADYHNEHFVYVNPLYLLDTEEGKNQWFALCTCGSPAVIINPKDAALTHEEAYAGNMLVCYVYMLTLTNFGVGRHSTGEGRRWW